MMSTTDVRAPCEAAPEAGLSIRILCWDQSAQVPPGDPTSSCMIPNEEAAPHKADVSPDVTQATFKMNTHARVVALILHPSAGCGAEHR